MAEYPNRVISCKETIDQRPADLLTAGVNVGRFTSYGVGGTADWFAAIDNVAELGEVLQFCLRERVNFRVLGAGSNVLVSDLGVRGVVARLKGDVFRDIRQENGAIVVGGAVTVGSLLNWGEARGLGGFEFLEGIPGTMGGIVRMNAGAFGHEICERVLWIRGLNREGVECRIDASCLEWEYRECRQLRDMVAVEIGLRADDVPAVEIASERRLLGEKREWQRGLRCCGSVFRNPEGESAGKIIEKAGLKGCRIGGAQVCSLHANFITAEKGASASDVAALIQRVQTVVFDRFGVALKREVELWGG
jgi:UDP-N-acetylmuramate dehydrogenase